jgi:hypothetical protein
MSHAATRLPRLPTAPLHVLTRQGGWLALLELTLQHYPQGRIQVVARLSQLTARTTASQTKVSQTACLPTKRNPKGAHSH